MIDTLLLLVFSFYLLYSRKAWDENHGVTDSVIVFSDTWHISAFVVSETLVICSISWYYMHIL